MGRKVSRAVDICVGLHGVPIRDLRGKVPAGKLRETAGNTAGAGRKIASIPRDGNLISENAAEAVFEFANLPRQRQQIVRIVTTYDIRNEHWRNAARSCLRIQ